MITIKLQWFSTDIGSCFTETENLHFSVSVASADETVLMVFKKNLDIVMDKKVPNILAGQKEAQRLLDSGELKP